MQAQPEAHQRSLWEIANSLQQVEPWAQLTWEVEHVLQRDLPEEPERWLQVVAEEMAQEHHHKLDVLVNQEQRFQSLVPQLFMELVAAAVDIQL